MMWRIAVPTPLDVVVAFPCIVSMSINVVATAGEIAPEFSGLRTMWLYTGATAHGGIAMSVENAATCRDRVAKRGSIVARAREFATP